MSKNKTVNPERTGEAIKYYHREAKKLGLEEKLYSYSSKKAIEQAQNGKYISQIMIDAFVMVLNASEDVLIGRVAIDESQTSSSSTAEALTDKELSDTISFGISKKLFPADIIQQLNSIAKRVNADFV